MSTPILAAHLIYCLLALVIIQLCVIHRQQGKLRQLRHLRLGRHSLDLETLLQPDWFELGVTSRGVSLTLTLQINERPVDTVFILSPSHVLIDQFRSYPSPSLVCLGSSCYLVVPHDHYLAKHGMIARNITAYQPLKDQIATYHKERAKLEGLLFNEILPVR